MEKNNVILILGVLILAVSVISGEYQLAELDIEESEPYVIYTAEDLKKYDGSDVS